MGTVTPWTHANSNAIAFMRARPFARLVETGDLTSLCYELDAMLQSLSLRTIRWTRCWRESEDGAGVYPKAK